MVRSILLTLAIFALPMLPSSAQATVIKFLEFNADGVLPSAEPAIGLFTFGEGVPEPTVFSASGGLLQQRTLSNLVNYSYGFPNTDVTGGGLVPGVPFVIEARLRIVAIQGSSDFQPSAFFQAFDGANRYSVFFDEDGLILLTAGSPTILSLDVFAFHTYRLEASGIAAGFTLFVDSAAIFTGTAEARGGNNGFNFGDGGNLSRGGTTGSDVDWDFIRLAQPIPTVTEPKHVAFFAGAFAMTMFLAAYPKAVRSSTSRPRP